MNTTTASHFSFLKLAVFPSEVFAPQVKIDASVTFREQSTARAPRPCQPPGAAPALSPSIASPPA